MNDVTDASIKPEWSPLQASYGPEGPTREAPDRRGSGQIGVNYYKRMPKMFELCEWNEI